MNIRYKLLVLFLVTGMVAAGKVAPAADLVLVGGTVYPSPGAKPIKNAVVVVREGKIVYVGKGGKRHTPRSAQLLECSGKVIVAGFWNSHVHFTEDAWKDAAAAPADKLEAHMQEMLTRWGFTTVWDLGSDPRNTLALRKRVEAKCRGRRF
jgi:predicted amidohydrolase YtcJ